MSRLGLFASFVSLALILGCAGEGSGSTGTAGSSGPTSGGSSSSGSSGSSGSASSSGSGASSGSTSEGSGTSSGSSGSSGSSTSSGSSGSSGSTSAGSSSGGTTGGLGESCEDLGAVDFGDCAAIVGWIFDGAGCTLVSGCGCEPHCGAVFAGPEACASTCAAAGRCNASLFGGAGIFKGPFEVGVYCDDVDVCTSDPMSLGALYPGVTCDPPAYPCDPAALCQVGDNGEVTAEAWEKYCAASLLPGVSGVKCVVWGP